MSARNPPFTRDEFSVQRALDTRWSDNDAYGHVNNVVYYAYFDTAVNAYLIEQGVLGKHSGHGVIGLVVETQCNYFSAVSFPDRLTVGLRVAHIGKSSVRYELGVFCEDDGHASAQGHFVHVYVDEATRRPVTHLPDALRNVLSALQRPVNSD